MRMVLGGLMMAAGLVAGAWAGVIWGLVGGIETAIAGFSAHPINGSEAAWGLVRCLGLWELIGAAAFLIFFLPGLHFLHYDSTKRTLARDRRFKAKYLH